MAIIKGEFVPNVNCPPYQGEECFRAARCLGGCRTITEKTKLDKLEKQIVRLEKRIIVLEKRLTTTKRGHEAQTDIKSDS